MQANVAFLLAAAGTASASSVPSLACFGEAPLHKYDLPLVESDLSGIAVASDGSVWAVNNGDAKIYELDFSDLASPTLVNSWDVSTVMADPEGIAHVTGRTFLIPDENPASVYSCVFPDSSDDAPVCSTVSSGISPAAGENQGFEGVASLADGSVYTVQEMNTPTLYSINTGTGAETKVVADARTDLSPALSVLGDMTHSYNATDEVFLLSKLPKGVFRVSLDGTPSITDQYAGQICDMNQAEGLAFFTREGVDYMLVVGEPTQVRIFKADPNCTLGLNATVGEMYACPVDESADVGCEKTLEDGGCEYSRCNKAVTPFIKICTDTEPGVTDCTEAECMQHCVNRSTDATLEADMIDGELCTHWAYDVKEKECYVFAGCNDMGFDEDYVQYALQDPTCEKTLADGGCAQRRCDKSTNNNEKVCTDTTPGTTDCTLDECYAKCTGYTNFTCTTFAYDVAEKECYVFETCDNEGHDDDYTTYVLVDPTCENSLDEEGCVQRRCSKTINDNEKVFAGDCDTVEKCQAACAVYEDFDCQYYAYDPVDKDCYVFKTCNDEGFDDDYTLYVLGYEEKLAVKEAIDEATGPQEFDDDSAAPFGAWPTLLATLSCCLMM